jgi:hypothetical protein
MISIIPVVRRACFEKAGLFDPSLPRGSDWDMWIRIAEHYEFEFVPEVLAKYYIHGDQLSSNLPMRILAWTLMLKKYDSVLSARPVVASAWLRHLGVLYGLENNTCESRRFILKSLRRNPWQIGRGSYPLLVLSFIPVLYRRMLKNALCSAKSRKVCVPLTYLRLSHRTGSQGARAGAKCSTNRRF